MSQHDGQHNRDSCSDYANLRKHLQGKTLQEIRGELDALLEEEVRTGVELDPLVIEEYAIAMEALAPDIGEREDVDLRWKKLMADNPDLFPVEEPAPAEPDHSKKRTVRRRPPIGRLLLAAALACTLLTGTAVAYQWPDYIVSWGKEILGIAPATSGTMTLSEPTEEGFATLEDALEYIDAGDVAMPTWVPERYTIEKITVQETSIYSMAVVTYKSSDSNMVMRVSCYNESAEIPDLKSEKDEYGEEFTHEDDLYYFCENVGIFQVSWESGNCLCSISGGISKQEAKDMINSIYRS